MQSSAYVTGWGVCLPNAPVDNPQIEQVLGPLPSQSAAVKRRILINNGITRRHYAIDSSTGAVTHTNAKMTADAIRNLCDGCSFSIANIECLACGTSSADQIIPSHASMVHAELGCPPCEVVATSGVCCSGVSAFKYGFLNVVAGACSNAVVTGSELASPSMRASHFETQVRLRRRDEADRALLPFSNEFLRWMLSDGAGALLIAAAPREDSPSLRIDWVDIESFAGESEVCMYFGMRKCEDGSIESYRTVDDEVELFRGGFLSLSQDVKVLNDRMPTLMRAAIRRMIQKRRLSADEVDWLLPHYSSHWFRQPLYDGLAELGFEIPLSRWFTNLAYKGNTGSAAMYIMVEELMASRKVQPGQRILCMVPESSRMLFGFVHLTAV
jgi:3-oxoacyl-[acyl-carrier-protein] synthase III